MEQGQHKGRSFPGAGLRDAKDILARHHEWNDGGLNGGGVGVALGRNGAKNGLGKAEISE
jgi:hypothetical protein